MLRKFLQGVLRAPEGDEGGSGGGGDGKDALAKAQAELAEYKRKEAELNKKATEAEKTAAKAAGESAKLAELYEAQIAALKGEHETTAKELAEHKAKIEAAERKERANALAGKVAAKLGVSVSPRLLGLLPQTGEDVAPEKLTDALIGKVTEQVLKLDPDLKSAGKPGAAAGTAAAGVDKDDPDYWRNVGRQLSGR